MNEAIPQSTCVIDYCHNIDCKAGECQASLNGYICRGKSGLRLYPKNRLQYVS